MNSPTKVCIVSINIEKRVCVRATVYDVKIKIEKVVWCYVLCGQKVFDVSLMKWERVCQGVF